MLRVLVCVCVNFCGCLKNFIQWIVNMRVSETEEEEECTNEKYGFLLLSMMMMIRRYR